MEWVTISMFSLKQNTIQLFTSRLGDKHLEFNGIPFLGYSKRGFMGNIFINKKDLISLL